MELIDMIVLGLLMILGIILSVLAEKNRELSKENRMLRELLIEGGEQRTDRSKDEPGNEIEEDNELSEKERIIALVSEGNSTEEVARFLNIPIDKVEMIIKFERIKKEHAPS